MNRSVTLALLLLGGALSVIVVKEQDTPSINNRSQSLQTSSSHRSQMEKRSSRRGSTLDHYRAALALPFPPGIHGIIHQEKNRRLQDAIAKLSPGALAQIMKEKRVTLWKNPESFARWGYYFVARYGELHPGESLKWAAKFFESYPGYCHYLLRGVAKANPDQAMDLLLELRLRSGTRDQGPSFQDVFKELAVKNRPRAWTLLQDPNLQYLRDYNSEAYVATLPKSSNWELEIEKFEILSGDRTGWRDHLLMRWAMFDPASAIAWKEQTFGQYTSDSEKSSRLSRVLERAAKEEPEAIRFYLESTSHDWPHREGIIQMLSRESFYIGHEIPELALKIETKERITAYWVDMIRHSPPHTVPGNVFTRIRAMGHLTPADHETLDRLEQSPAK